MKLQPGDFRAARSVHYGRANAALDSAIKSDPAFALAMEKMIPGVTRAVGAAGGRANPPGHSWHHGLEPGVMQLVPTRQHRGSQWQHLFHPGGKGGYATWGKPP
ncbi:MAG: HNH endonuclease [Deltaproteobacteria bacterium]|nr:HNH endonuclease [Deltaproteobacteria bacterium]